MKFILISILLSFSFLTFSQDKPAYVIYNAKGKKVSYKKMLQAAMASDITFFGEFHDNTIAHWLELELTMDMARLTNNRSYIGL
ncbi:MAG: hypothetical protein R2779_10405 [Crocinitomicaceae bacterium]